MAERDPLLSVARPNDQNGSYAAPTAQGHAKQSQAKPGPLEITRRTRYAILAGVWTATFLSVCQEFVSGGRVLITALHNYPVFEQ